MAFLLAIPAFIAGILGNISLLQWTAGVVIFATWFYFHMTKDYGKWEKKGMFSLKPTFLLGNNTDMILAKKNHNDLHLDFYTAYKEHGIAINYDGSEPVFYVTDPALMTKIQITDFDHFYNFGFFPEFLADRPENQMGLASSKDKEWKKFKMAVTPAFRLKHMQNIADDINMCANRLVEHIKPNSLNGKTVDFSEACNSYTLNCISRSVLSMDVNPFTDPNSEWIKMGKGLMEEWRFILAAFLPKLLTTFSISTWGVKSANFFIKLANQEIEKRSKMVSPPQDILGIMLKSRNNQLEGEDMTGVNITDKMIAETIMQFFMDGYTTVALFLKYTCFYLACNPDCQDRAFEEVEEFMEKYNSDPNRENLDALAYLDQVMSETARLAAFPISARMCTKPWKIPGKDITMPKGSRVIMNFGGTQIDEKYFSDPMTFEPDRFSPENKKNIVPGSYQPWGQGPRQCIGVAIARLESKLMLFHLLKNFRLEKSDSTVYPLKWTNSGFMENVGGVNLKLVPRK